jgi:hypothetical protein
MAFKEQVTFYADESRTAPLFGFKARQRLDIGAMHDVTDAAGSQIGWFRKDFTASLLRSTWHMGMWVSLMLSDATATWPLQSSAVSGSFFPSSM